MCLPFVAPRSKPSIRASNRLFGRFGTSQEGSLL